MSKHPLVLVLLILLALAVLPAGAATIALGAPNAAMASYRAPFATVTITLGDGFADIGFDAASTADWAYLFGSNGAVAVNVNGPFTLGGSSATGPFNPPAINGYAFGNVSEFGRFNLVFHLAGGFTRAASQVSFRVFGSWEQDEDVLAANDDGYLAAAHVFATDAALDRSNGAAVTGYVASTVPTIPDGATTLTLLGLALAGMTAIARRRV